MQRKYNKALKAIECEANSSHCPDEAIEFIQNVTFDVLVLNKDIEYFDNDKVGCRNPKAVLNDVYNEAFKDVSPKVAIAKIRRLLSRNLTKS